MFDKKIYNKINRCDTMFAFLKVHDRQEEERSNDKMKKFVLHADKVNLNFTSL